MATMKQNADLNTISNQPLKKAFIVTYMEKFYKKD
jgi:hypothetical protein